MRIAPLLLCTCLLTACSLAPDFKLPEMSIPTFFKQAPAPEAKPEESPTVPSFNEQAEAAPVEKVDVKPLLSEPEQGSWKLGEPAEAQPRGEWWRVFNDETLNTLEAQAIESNLDIKAAAARVVQARGLVGVAQADFFPSIDGSAGVTRQQLNAAAFGGSTATTFKPQTLYSGLLGLNYEIDLFGRVLENWRATSYEAESTEATLKSVTLTLQADVAQTYFSLRAADAEVARIKESLSLREDSLRVLQKRLEVGIISEIDEKREVAEVETLRTQLLSIEQQRRELEHALAVLLGKTPAEFDLEEAPFAFTAPIIPAGLPSSLLERRPDIAAAQGQLAAANSRIGLARAAFFPDIVLTGSGGVQSTAFSKLFHWASRTWSIGPMLTVPIFQAGKAFSNLDRVKGAHEEAVALYKKQVLTAFREVEDNLSRVNTLQKQSAAQDIAASAATRAANLLKRRFDEGDVSTIEWVDARRTELAAQRTQIQVQRDRLNATIQLIRALGGSWDTPPKSAETVIPTNSFNQ